jgi:hypothetical protein
MEGNMKITLLVLAFVSMAFGITVTDYGDHQVFQRLTLGNGMPADTADGRSIVVAGTYTGSPTSISAKVVRWSDDSLIKDWTVINASPTGGTFSDSLKNVNSGGWYKIRVKSSTAGDSATGVNKWGVGIIVAPFGQSMQIAYKTDSTDHPRSDLTGRCLWDVWYPMSDDWQETSPRFGYTSVIPSMASAIADSFKIPVGICGYVVGGTMMYHASATSIWHYRNAANHLDTSTGSLYSKLLMRVDVQRPEIFVLDQGETDAGNSTTKEQWKTCVRDIHAWLEEDLGYKPSLFINQISPYIYSYSDQVLSELMEAQAELDSAAGKRYFASVKYDLPLYRFEDYSQFHLTYTSQGIFGKRVAKTLIKYVAGSLASGYRGPRIDSIYTAARGKLRCRIVYGAGTSVITSGGIGNFRLNDSTGATNLMQTTALSSVGGAKLLINVANRTFLRPCYLHYARGRDIDFSSIIYDNDSLPLEPLFDNFPVTIVADSLPASTDRFWKGASTDWSLTSNWSATTGGAAGASVPDSSNDVILDGGGNAACYITAATNSCKSFTTTSAYTALNYCPVACSLKVYGSIDISGSAQPWHGGKLIIATDGDYYNLSGSPNASYVPELIMRGNGVYNNRVVNNVADSVCFAYPGKTLIIAQTNAAVAGAAVAKVNGGKLILNGAFTVSGTKSNPLEIVTGSEIYGTGTNQLGIYMTGSTPTNYTIPSISIKSGIDKSCGLGKCNGDIGVFLIKSGSGTGNINVNKITTIGALHNTSYTANATFNLLDSINCGSYVYGCQNAGHTLILNAKSATIQATSVIGNSVNAGPVIDSLNESKWIVRGAWTSSSNHTVVPYKSTITFKKTATITTANQPLHKVYFDSTGQTFTLGDSLKVCSYTVRSGTLNQNGKVIVQGFSQCYGQQSGGGRQRRITKLYSF